MLTRRSIVTAGAAVVWTAASTRVHAQASPYPNKSIRLIVPYPAGGGTDVVARMVSQKLGEALGQSLVVDNKAGAGTTIGLGELARSPADGYTIGVGGTSDPLLPLLYENLSFSPTTDLVFVSTLASSTLVLAVGTNVPARNVSEFIALAKSKSASPLAYASVGVSSPHHLAGIHFASMAGVQLTHTPYRGTAPAVTDLVGGHIPAAMLGLPSALPFARNGKLRILGVASPKRSPLAPDIPTIAESGLKGFEAGFWYHIVVPKGTPKPIVERLRTEIDRIVSSAEMKEAMAKGGFESLTLSPEESERALRADTARWTQVIRDNNIRGS
jgi:tripartite-type tricarboxylate transporter receptor subunit TctC